MKPHATLFAIALALCAMHAGAAGHTVAVSCADGWGAVYVDTPGRQSAETSGADSVTIHAVPAEGCSFVGWRQTEPAFGDTLITDPVYTLHGIGADTRFRAVFSRPGEKTVFEDDFVGDSPIPDQTKWRLCRRTRAPWARHMSESYDQAYVRDGNLVLVGEVVDGQYRAGGIRMLPELGFQYGRVEVTARFASMAPGAWPAIWMLASKPLWEGWPEGGEIDIMEHLNLDPDVWNVLHSYYIDELGHKSDPQHSANPAVDTSRYNTYAVDWTADSITFSINGVATLTYPNLHLPDNDTVKQWPFDAPFYLILNNALGGPDTWPGPIDDAMLPTVFLVDRVRVTQPTVLYSD